MSDDLFAKGLEIRKAVLGAEYVDKSLANADDFMMAFQELVTENCWGTIWGREGISARDRSMINVAMLSTLGKTDELKLHVRGAVNNGLSVEEIKETLLQVSVYAGIPAGLNAFKAAHAALKEMGQL